MNMLRKKIANKETILGTLVSLTDPCLCEIMGNVGYDCVWIDMEHTPKNILIRGVKKGSEKDGTDYRKVMEFFGVSPTLENLQNGKDGQNA